MCVCVGGRAGGLACGRVVPTRPKTGRRDRGVGPGRHDLTVLNLRPPLINGTGGLIMVATDMFPQTARPFVPESAEGPSRWPHTECQRLRGQLDSRWGCCTGPRALLRGSGFGSSYLGGSNSVCGMYLGGSNSCRVIILKGQTRGDINLGVKQTQDVSLSKFDGQTPGCGVPWRVKRMVSDESRNMDTESPTTMY